MRSQARIEYYGGPCFIQGNIISQLIYIFANRVLYINRRFTIINTQIIF
jgi:hypothetical protein